MNHNIKNKPIGALKANIAWLPGQIRGYKAQGRDTDATNAQKILDDSVAEIARRQNRKSTRLEPERSSEAEAVLDALMDGPAMTADIADETGLQPIEVRRIIRRLQAVGLVHLDRVVRNDIRTRVPVYALTRTKKSA